MIHKLRTRDLGRQDIYIYRFNNTQAPNARIPHPSGPCSLCRHMLKKHRIGRVYFLDQNNQPSILKHSELEELSGDPAYITQLFIQKQLSSNQLRFDPQEFSR